MCDLTKTVLSLLLSGVLTQTSSVAQIEIRQPLDSPRLAALKKGLESGDGNALEEFWRQVSGEDAPLIEPIQGDAQNLLVTFLWRDAAAQKFVAVFPFARVNPLPHLMARLSGTDLWYKSYRLRRDARFEYQISANDSLAPFAAADPVGEGGWPPCARTRSTRASSPCLKTLNHRAEGAILALSSSCRARPISPSSRSA